MTEACPVCGYLLRGLKEPIRCPECGLQLGIDPQLFRPSGNAWLVPALVWGVSAILVFILLLTNGREPVLYYWWVAILAFGSLGSLFRWYLARSRFLIVSETQVRVFENNVETACVPLDAHTDARWEWTTGRVTFYRSGAESGASFGPQSGRLGRAIVRTIEGRIRQQLASD